MFNYRHSLKTINRVLAKHNYTVVFTEHTHYSSNFQLLENGQTCGEYSKKIDLVSDINKILAGEVGSGSDFEGSNELNQLASRPRKS